LGRRLGRRLGRTKKEVFRSMRGGLT